jgi:signal transduction histidine kinase
VIEGTANAELAYNAYQAADLALLDALNLSAARADDAIGFQSLVALDALMRSNEDSSSASAIIVGSSIDPALDGELLTQVMAADQANLDRFRRLVIDPDDASVVDLVDQGDAGTRVRLYARQVTSGVKSFGSAEQVSQALTAALTYTGLRRLAQDHIARDVAQRSQDDASTAQLVAVLVTAGAALLFFGVLALGIVVGRAISTPLQQVTRAVGDVAELSRAELVRVADSDQLDEPPPELASVQIDSRDEIGQLADAVNRVQAAAAELLVRQATARANVATMFANVARRTQNLVDRQLELIDELERQVADDKVRGRVYHLDHVTSRLRRSADSLMVISGTVDQQLSTAPTPLNDVVGGALAEIEGYAAVQVANLPAVVVAAEVAGDLRLLLAELLENATNFSPPGTPVQVSASMERGLVIAVEDHGLGMGPNRLLEENRRLVERERLDVMPTRVLGLFVVGRLARRHGLTVRLEPSEGRGVTAVVGVPSRVLGPDMPAQLTQVPAQPVGLVPAQAIAAIDAASRSGPFPWLATRPSLPAIGAGALDEPTRAMGLRQRIPGRQLAEEVGSPVDLTRTIRLGRVVRDPEAERAALHDYQSGLERASAEPTEQTGDLARPTVQPAPGPGPAEFVSTVEDEGRTATLPRLTFEEVSTDPPTIIDGRPEPADLAPTNLVERNQ